jgi:hypothetical protein
MAKTKNGQDAFINRNQYNAIKKMDRVEIEVFLKSIYDKGFSEGQKSAKCDIAEITVGQRSEIINELLELITAIPGIGTVPLRKINDELRKENGGE